MRHDQAGRSPAICISGLTKHFRRGAVRAVDGIDAVIDRGEIVAFLGPNGAGKTTALDMVLGLTTPTSGTITVNGSTPREAIATGEISAVLQTGGLLNDLRVGEVVDYIASTYRTPTLGREALDRAGIAHLAGRKVSLCSGGEQQRLKFALSLLPNPHILVLDEPTAGMDVAARRSFWATMQAEAREGRTIIFATHYLEEAQAFAERVILIAHGRVIADGPMEKIRTYTDIRVLTARVADERAVHDVLQRFSADLSYTLDDGILIARDRDTDGLARALLAINGVSALEIAAPSLEDAFVDMTKDRPL
ncbi:ABC transporter ATP-binding protein [Flaviflexus huanghaiensis]|uniref:ABC transporter ATP-binding protein n=1 Tax=Flaviflexus huanghaiensis TaxID=1111473 RepID=UPI0015F8CB52|nr:ABC transporter ATP-binding protein [Flaviflexus huanghaiensis]